MQHDGFSLINGDFKERENAKIYLSGDQCLTLRSAVAADVAFLEAHNHTDYSLLFLSVDRKSVSDTEQTLTCASSPGEPRCYEQGTRLYTLSIVDYLNNYNSFRDLTVSPILKSGYAKSINTYVKKICATPAESEFRNNL